MSGAKFKRNDGCGVLVANLGLILTPKTYLYHNHLEEPPCHRCARFNLRLLVASPKYNSYLEHDRGPQILLRIQKLS